METLAKRVQYLVDFHYSPTREAGTGSVNAAAKAWGVSRGALRAILGGKGKSSPRMETLTLIAQGSGARKEWVSFGEGQRFPAGPPMGAAAGLIDLGKRLGLPFDQVLALMDAGMGPLHAGLYMMPEGDEKKRRKGMIAVHSALRGTLRAWEHLIADWVKIFGKDGVAGAIEQSKEELSLGFNPLATYLLRSRKLTPAMWEKLREEHQAQLYDGVSNSRMSAAVEVGLLSADPPPGQVPT